MLPKAAHRILERRRPRLPAREYGNEERDMDVGDFRIYLATSGGILNVAAGGLGALYGEFEMRASDAYQTAELRGGEGR